ncbi:MAG: hypothetical protein QOE65_1609 [Solirubrobacteraceae bacterium]|jgi:hypothetical protein|nr:hypothetical protein [Solirubrobacteraceae bacterium]
MLIELGVRIHIVAITGLAVAAGLTGAAPAGAHVLSLARARSAATVVAKRLARARGDDAPARYTRPLCRRASQHRFICLTTLRGTTRCDPAEPACDGTAPFEVRYRIIVAYPSERARNPRTYVAQA